MLYVYIFALQSKLGSQCTITKLVTLLSTSTTILQATVAILQYYYQAIQRKWGGGVLRDQAVQAATIPELFISCSLVFLQALLCFTLSPAHGPHLVPTYNSTVVASLWKTLFFHRETPDATLRIIHTYHTVPMSYSFHAMPLKV
jgi:hypothetical protein